MLHREYGGHFDEIQSLSWSRDSRFFVSASKDLTARIWSLDPEEHFDPTVLSGHRESVKNAWFSSDQESVYTISQDGALFRWEFVSSVQQNGADDEMIDIDDERWRIVQREYFLLNNAKLKCASFHASTNLLTVRVTIFHEHPHSLISLISDILCHYIARWRMVSLWVIKNRSTSCLGTCFRVSHSQTIVSPRHHDQPLVFT